MLITIGSFLSIQDHEKNFALSYAFLEVLAGSSALAACLVSNGTSIKAVPTPVAVENRNQDVMKIREHH
jgi:hypothetical protein